MNNRAMNAKRGLLWGLFANLVGVFVPFLTRTVLIYKLGIEYDGLKTIFSSLLEVFSLAELGIGGALSYSMYKPASENKTDEVNALLNLYRKVYRWVGFAVIILGIIAIPLLPFIISGDVPTDINIYILYFVYLLNNIVGYFTFAHKGSLLNALQKNDIVSKVKMISVVFMNLAQIFVLLIWADYYIFVIFIPLATILNNMLLEHISKRKYPEMYPVGEVDKQLIKKIKKDVKGMFAQKIGGVVLVSVDSIIISIFLGLKVLGVYNGYYYIIVAINSFLGAIKSAITPSIGNSIIMESKDKNYEDFKKFNFLYTWLIIWCSVCLMVLYQPFIEMWQGKNNMFEDKIVFLLVLNFLIGKLTEMSFFYKEAKGLWWQGKYVPLINATTNLVVNLLLVNIIGLSGVIISTIISTLFIGVPFGSLILFKYYFESLQKWFDFLGVFVKNLFFAIITIGITYFIAEFIEGDKFVIFVIRIVICIIIPNIILLVLNCNNKELKNALSFIKYIVKR